MSILFFTPKPDIAFIRTGGLFSNKPKVSTTNILIRIPILHSVTPINLRSFGVNVARIQNECLKAKDVFVDIKAVFTMQIDPQNPTKAAEAFGDQTFNLDKNHLIHSILDGILREVTATMTLDELQEHRAEFVKNITITAEEKFTKLGLLLLNTTIATLEQTGIKYINKDDILGARTSAITMQEIQKNRKIENDALQDNDLLIAQKNNDATLKKIDIDVELKNKIVEAEKKQVEFAKDKQIAIAQATAEQEKASQTALIAKDIAILEKEKLKLGEQVNLAKTQEELNHATINAETVRLKGIKEREREMAIIEAQQVAESNAIQIEREAKANYSRIEQNVNANVFTITKEAEANYCKIEQEAKAIERLAEAKRKDYETEAAGIEAKNNAANKLDDRIIAYNTKMKLIETLPSIITALVKPMESIKDVKIISVGGLSNVNGGNATSENNKSDNIVNSIYEQAFKFKVNSGVVNGLLKDIGININEGNIADIIPNFNVEAGKSNND